MSRANKGRIAAARALVGVHEGGHIEDLLALHAPPKGPDRGLAWHLGLGCLRWRGALDHALQPFLRQPAHKLDPGVRAALWLGLFEIHLSRTPTRAAVDQAVEVTKAIGLKRASGLVNAVLRRASTTALSTDHQVLLPPWLYERWNQHTEWLDRIRDPARISVCGTPPANVDVSPASLGGSEIANLWTFEGKTGDVSQLDGFDEGRFWVMDPAAAKVADLVNDALGGTGSVLDACAAPGGKTFRLVSKGHNVTALDHSPDRLDQMAENLYRLNMNVETAVHDWLTGPWANAKTFDAVLVDAPCTGLGIVRRHPEVIWRRKPGDPAAMAITQRAILKNAAQHVSTNGVLVYSVCSMEPEEGSEVVKDLDGWDVTAEWNSAPPHRRRRWISSFRSEKAGSVMASSRETPMMRQYTELKSQVPDALLFYRMGDFYELFFNDAEVASQVCELTLTSRNSKDPDPIPMCGVPHHAADGYLRRLVDGGHKVAIAEQVDTPGEGKPKLMRRELVRVVSPGVPWDSDQIDAREACFLMAVYRGETWGLAFLDVSTGELRVTEASSAALAAREIQRLTPREAIVGAELHEETIFEEALRTIPTTTVESAWFDEEAAHRGLNQLFGTHDLTGFGASTLGSSLQAANALISYVRDTARVSLEHVQELRPYAIEGHMVIDETTRRNLELFRPLRGQARKGTLIHLLDETCTPMGGRCLRDWLSHPLIDPAHIHHRQDAVEALLKGPLREELRRALKTVADLERLGTKAAQSLANARDLTALGVSLEAVPNIVSQLAQLEPFKASIPTDLMDDVRDDINNWLVSDPPISISEGGLIRRGLDPDLDELITLSTEGKTAIAAIEAREREATGITSLKVRHNKVFGYFLEVTQANLSKVPDSWHRKQTLSNAERFITPELKEFEEKVVGADEKRKALEYDLFCQLRSRVGDHISRLQSLARWIAQADAYTALASLASNRRYVRPLVDDSDGIELRKCRHPVVEAMSLDEPFVPNDIVLDDDRRLVILTGPNMAGKSTVMRTVALCVLMAQIGGFVPADSARIGVSDRLFVRVGASDDLAHGRSTFMVEMSETALILNQATSRSLVLLDEIGRGTSTLDGLSIAWAVAESIHDRIKARTIFATHYHELIGFAEERAGAMNMHVGVREWGERIVFLRTLKPGGASKSYGIQCARLAGMPSIVVERARGLLTQLEAERAKNKGPQLSLFGSRESPVLDEQEPHAVVAALKSIEPDALTPRAALDALYRLKELEQT